MKMKLLFTMIFIVLLSLITPRVVMGGEVERTAVLESLENIESLIYLGNSGSIGMGGAAHPSILSTLLDAKAKNDNSLIGNTNVFLIELATFGQVIDSLNPEVDDLSLINIESEAITGLSFIERMQIVLSKLGEVDLLLAEAGINNLAQLDAVHTRITESNSSINAVIELFNPVCEFPDPSLDAIVREAIGIPEGPIYQNDVDTLSQLNAVNQGIANLDGSQCLTNLVEANLFWNQISDISPLTGLSNLEILVLGDNQIIDISPLTNLTNLELLHLADNQISDIGPISGLTNLWYLGLSYNQISDITPLLDMKSGSQLWLVDNPLSPESIALIPVLEANGVMVWH